MTDTEVDEQSESEAPKRKRRGTLKSGWCMTGHDKSCPVDFSFGQCECTCHQPEPVKKPRKRAAKK